MDLISSLRLFLLLVSILAALTQMNRGRVRLYLKVEFCATVVIESARLASGVHSTLYLIVWWAGQAAVVAAFLWVVLEAGARLSLLFAFAFGILLSLYDYSPQRHQIELIDGAVRMALGLALAFNQKNRIHSALAVMWLTLAFVDYGLVPQMSGMIWRTAADVLPCIVVVGTFWWIALFAKGPESQAITPARPPAPRLR